MAWRREHPAAAAAAVPGNSGKRASLRTFYPVSALLLSTALAVVSGCDGPKEKAGREQDRVRANAAGVDAPAEGPAEKIGEAQDRADAAAAKARDAAAKALETRADALRRDADVAADRLEERAKAVRNSAQDVSVENR